MILLNSLKLGWVVVEQKGWCEGYKLRIGKPRRKIMTIGMGGKENEEQKQRNQEGYLVQHKKNFFLISGMDIEVDPTV